MVFRTASDRAFAGRQAGAAFALELVGLLHGTVRVWPTPYHGGHFRGRNCHTIGDKCVIVCAALKGRVSGTHLASDELEWSLWNGLRKMLNRAIIIPPMRSFAFGATPPPW